MYEDIKIAKSVDCLGLYCPAPVMRTREEIDKLQIGDVMEMFADDPASEEDIKAWAKRTEQGLLGIEKTSEGFRFIIKKVK